MLHVFILLVEKSPEQKPIDPETVLQIIVIVYFLSVILKHQMNMCYVLYTCNITSQNYGYVNQIQTL